MIIFLGLVKYYLVFVFIWTLFTISCMKFVGFLPNMFIEAFHIRRTGNSKITKISIFRECFHDSNISAFMKNLNLYAFLMPPKYLQNLVSSKMQSFCRNNTQYSLVSLNTILIIWMITFHN